MVLLQRLNRPVIALVAVGLLAAGIRFTALSRPGELIFDENYYAKDGCLYAGYSLRECRVTEDAERYWVLSPGAIHEGMPPAGEVGSWVHPPLGKWMISIGESLFGPTPFGWRFSAALFGSLTVVLLAGIAQLIWRKPVWTFVAGLLLATEGLHVVQSRVALLDVFLGFWVVLGYLLLVVDRRWIGRRDERAWDRRASWAFIPIEMPRARRRRDQATRSRVPVATSPLWRPWRFAAGVALGAAVATKWSGATALMGAIVLSVLWERTRRARAGRRHPIWRSVQQEGFGIVVLLMIVPIAIYLLAYSRWWLTNGFHPGQWAVLQDEMASFHRGLSRYKEGTKELVHPYLSEPWTWPAITRPVSYYWKAPGAAVVTIGNPAIFWTSVLTVPYLAAAWGRRRDWSRGLVLVAILAQWLPWFLFSDRVQFFFYMTPIVPFLVLAAVFALK
ncbi:MAG: phospholipid carrier-dependent glycosyltransferase, partial [Actinomycetota bacterium]